MWIALSGCYLPPVLPLQGEVPIVAAPAAGCREDEDRTVACTIDGDTVDLGACGEGGERVRLLGIDAPEIGPPPDCFADEAWDRVMDTIDGEEVTVSFDRVCTDVYDRTLAYVWLRGDLFDTLAGDGEFEPWTSVWIGDPEEPALLLNEVLLGEGYARLYPEEIAGTLVFQDRLDRATAAAEQSSRGLWGVCNGDD